MTFQLESSASTYSVHGREIHVNDLDSSVGRTELNRKRGHFDGVNALIPRVSGNTGDTSEAVLHSHHPGNLVDWLFKKIVLSRRFKITVDIERTSSAPKIAVLTDALGIGV